ncbi:SUKH-4 family immunity protein [Streptomyces sp. S-9]|uniref:SUKH-4 family immunity protein n=2 Tax=Streptomyces TaxID=1883 RepID=UPI00193BD144|nr:SUKH-4 family immunity protein [Streptomyces sp. S-9]
MVTFAQAQERAEEWVNGDVPAYQHREVRVREFGLGFVVWAEDRADGPRSDGGGQRLVIARDSGEATLWPSLPVGEVIRRYEEEYGRDETAAEEPAPAPARVDLNQTSFLLSPPEWLQEAADRLGIPDRRGETSGGAAGAAAGSGSGAGPVPGQAGAPDAGWASSSAGAGRGAGASGAGEAPPAQVIVLPVVFEGKVLGVIELASFTPFTAIQKDFLTTGPDPTRASTTTAASTAAPSSTDTPSTSSTPTPAPPGAPGAPGVPGAPPGAMPPGAMPPGTPPPGVPVPGQPPAYGYPQQPPGQPTVGPGYQAVLRYRAQDGSEQQLIRRSAPGTPHPEWQIFHELRAMNVPPNQVLELHTELESCELPGAYCARMIREQWPQARITSIAPYGTDHASRQQGMRQLLAHQGELHQVADGPARPAPVRAPIPPVQPAPPLPPEAIGQELAAAFGPGVFRFEQAAVSRQGVPPVVAHTLVTAGLPMDMGPFFWAQAQPGRPVPTLAELAAERGVQPAPDAGSYLVMGSDFGKAVCVQYGTANIVAVPVEAGPGGAAVPPQFVNTGLPEFARCLALLGRMWRLRFGLNQEQAGRWTVDFQAQLAALDPAALGSPETWWSVLLEQMWDGLL